MFVLPKRYNSLSDVGKDPFGALANAAQWVVPLAMGMPGGFADLPRLFSNPAMLSKWSLGNASKMVGGLRLGKLGTKDALLGVSALALAQSQRSSAGDAMGRIADKMGELAKRYYPVDEALSQLRLQSLQGLPSRSQYEAQIRDYAETLLRQQESSERARGVRTLSGARRNAEIATQAGRATANYPMEYLRAVWGLPFGAGFAPLSFELQNLQRMYSEDMLRGQSLAQAVAMMFPYLLRG